MNATRDPANEHIDQTILKVLKPLYRTGIAYHDYKVVGFEHVPQQGPGLVVFNHSLATYDIFLFGAKVYVEKKRLIASLADRLIFKTPGLRQLALALSSVQGEPHMARALLEAGRLVGVAPGGMREALRPSHQKYQLSWERRFGFAKLAIEAQVPVFLAACPLADDLFTVLDTPLTRFVYERFRAPLPVAFGLGLLPRPIALTTYLSAPIQPPRSDGAEPSHELIGQFHGQLVERMNELMQQGV